MTDLIVIRDYAAKKVGIATVEARWPTMTRLSVPSMPIFLIAIDRDILMYYQLVDFTICKLV